VIGRPRRRAVDPGLLDEVRQATASARRTVHGARLGVHRSRLLGGGSEFNDYKPYDVGDDPRHLDPKVLARTDRYVVRRYESDRQLSATVLLDRSASMGFGTVEHDKWHVARSLALAIAFVLLRQGDRVGVSVADGQGTVHRPPRGGDRQLDELALAAMERRPAGDAALADTLGAVLARAGRGLVIVVSDLLSEDGDAWLEQLGVHAARGGEAWVLQVVDPAERDFPYDEPARFVGLEGGELSLNPRELAAEYRAQFAAFCEGVRKRCLDAGAHHVLIDSSEPLGRSLRRFLES
jgi:uncharacterized protein (DUF58 family)